MGWIVSLIIGGIVGWLASIVMAQMSPVGLWRSVDDKTAESKAEIRIAESGGALAGRIEKTLRRDAKPDAA